MDLEKLPQKTVADCLRRISEGRFPIKHINEMDEALVGCGLSLLPQGRYWTPGRDIHDLGACRVTHGPNDSSFPNLAGKTVDSVRRALASVYSIPDHAEAYIGGSVVGPEYCLRAGDSVEFLSPWGRKGVDYPISPLQSSVIRGDCLEELDLLPVESVELVGPTSPPYLNARPACGTFRSYDHYLSFLRAVIRKCHRVLIEGRFFVMNLSPVLVERVSRKHSSTRFNLPADAHRIFMEEGFEFIEDITWVKPEGAKCGRGRRFNTDRNPLAYKTVPVTERILVYRKKSKKLIDWSIRNHPDREIVAASKISDGYEKTDAWRISPAWSKGHPAVFPLALAEKVIRYYSFVNDIILDPFAGVGTTGIAAMKLGRRYFLIEKQRRFLLANLNQFRGAVIKDF